MLLGPKINTVFKSRWNAVFWSLGVLLTAYCSVPSKDQAEQPANTEAVAKIMAKHGFKDHQSDHHTNPWAKTPD